MKKLYIVKKEFYQVLLKYPMLISHVEAWDPIQRDRMFEKIDMYDLMESASFYFQKSVMLDHDILSVSQEFSKRHDGIACKQYYILFDEERNPFIQLIKRKFRYVFIHACENDS